MMQNSEKENGVLVLDVRDCSKICRICLSTQAVYPIFTVHYKEKPFASFLDSCATVHVSYFLL